MSAVEVETCGDWQIATAPGELGGFMSWGKMGRITGTNPVNEPGEHVWFNFGGTREQASRNLKVELGLERI